MERRITLSDSEDAPTLLAECDDKGWNGFHVPHLTAADLRRHYADLQRNDPNASWDQVKAYHLTGPATGTRYGVVVISSTGDYESEDRYECDTPDGRAWIDGLCWSDPY